MKYKFAKLFAYIPAFCMITVSVTGCINNKTENQVSEDINTETTLYNEEYSINETDSSADISETDVESSQVQAETEIIVSEENSEQNEDIDSENLQNEKLYKPAEEILTTDFSSGLIQIGNDVFRLGGYLTVDQFISEYGDRYDMSNIDTESVWVQKENTHARVVSEKDPEVEFEIFYKPADDAECLVRDAIVYNIIANEHLLHFPTGLTYHPEPDVLNKDDIEPLLESIGLIRVEDTKENHCNSYKYYVSSKYDQQDVWSYKCYIKGDEINLFGTYPIYCYKISLLETFAEGLGLQEYADNVSIDFRSAVISETENSSWFY